MFKPGDVVPYVGTAGAIKYARIVSFEPVGKDKVWFRGSNVNRGGRMIFKPLYKSLELIAKGY